MVNLLIFLKYALKYISLNLFQILTLTSGGRFSKTISKNVDILIAEDENSDSSKTAKARKLGIKIMGENVLFESKKSLSSTEKVNSGNDNDDYSIQPKNILNEGDKITIQGDSGSEYYIKRVSDHYYCT